MKDKIKQVLAQRELARRDLTYFMKYKFKYYYNKEFRNNWHYEYISEHLKECLSGNIKRLIINEPPSYGKTEQVVRSFIPFAWLSNPFLKVIYTTYGDDLTKGVAKDTHEFVKSSVYANLQKQENKLKWVSNETKFFMNDKGGMLRSTTVAGAITGMHCDCLIIDDPLKASEAYSNASRQNVIEWYKNSLQSRLLPNAFIIIIMQRLHTEDLIGHILDNNEPYTHIELKALEEEPKTYIINDFCYERKANEPLHPLQHSLDELERLRVTMGNDGFMTQYQQDPRVSIAGFFEVDRLKELQNYELPTHNEYIIIDPAESTSKTADNRAITCMGVWSENGEISYAIKDCLFGKWELDESIQNIINMMYEYPNAKVFIEPMGGGITLKRELEKAVVKQNAKLLSSGKNPLKNTIDSLKVDKQKNAKNERIMALKLYINTGNLAMRYDAKGKEQIIKELNAFNPERKANEDNCIDTVALCVANTHTLKPYEIKQNATNKSYKRKTTWNI